ncbi:hypothetical protein [Tenacibaculum sp.]|uniref:hypothetical protein n=1 Tax=Tenacibaculum sp. TaxID=1906242 RepID=UPI003D0D85EC
MKKVINKKSSILLFVGALTIATSQILTHYTEMSDTMQGLGIGIGIGLLIIAITTRAPKTS